MMKYIQDVLTGIRQAIAWLIRASSGMRIAGEIAAASQSVVFSWDLLARRVYILAGSHSCLGITLDRKFHSPEWWLERIHPEDRGRIARLIQSINLGQETLSCAYRVRADNNTYINVLDRSRIVWRRGKVARIVGVTSDISLLATTQEELEQHRRKAESASQAKSRFLTAMSHELRTPLGAIMAAGSLIENNCIPDKDRSRYLNIIRRNARQMLALINELLDLAKIESGTMRVDQHPVHLRHLLEQVLETSRLRADTKGIVLKLEACSCAPQELPPEIVRTDGGRLRQVLSNLVINAIKFTDNGTIGLSVSRNPETENLEIRVRDTGIGISRASIERLFQPFEQLHHKRSQSLGGVGMGLNLSRKLAGLLGGSLELEKSVEGEGSTFLLTLPLDEIPANEKAASRTPPEIEKATPEPDPGKQGKLETNRVLVVDDADDNRLLLARILELNGAEVQSADNGESAIALLATMLNDASGKMQAPGSGSSAPPVVLMDIEMPVMDGPTALMEIRKRKMPVRVVALTAHAMPGHRKEYLQMGFDGYLTKPIDQTALVDEIRRLG